MKSLPLIIGFGGINAAGRSSFHHGYQRMVFDALNSSRQQECLQSLSVLMHGNHHQYTDKASLLDGTLIRRIESHHFDVDRVQLNRKVCINPESPITFTLAKRQLPLVPPGHWQITEIDNKTVKITSSDPTDFFISDEQVYPVQAAGQIPRGFNPGDTYNSRNHPRGLQLAVYAATDALRSTGIPWQQLQNAVPPEKISVYASSAMGQLDEAGTGGMLRSNLQGKRVSSKHCPMGFPDMPADFINAYLLGNVGTSGAMAGACATFLYNLNAGIQDIQQGKAEIAIIGASEAPIVPEVMEGYRAMSALADDDGLRKLDGDNGPANHRTACRPFANNCGFTIAESSQFIVLCSDRLALEMGATIYGAVPSVFIHADGIKRSISAPGIGNYLTVGRALNTVQQALSDHGGLSRSFVMAHGTGTPQNRVTESHILNKLATKFGIQDWPVAAIKCFVGHSIGVAGGDQIAAALGVFKHGIIPGINTVDSFAEDVSQSHLSLSTTHQATEQPLESAVINAKGFGGNNASAVLLSDLWCQRYLQGRHGKASWSRYQEKQEAVQGQQNNYKDQLLTEIPPSIYRFGEPEIKGEDLTITSEEVNIPGYRLPVSLKTEFPY